MMLDDLNMISLWCVGLLLTFARPKAVGPANRYTIGIAIRRALVVGWSLAVISFCLFEVRDEALRAFGLWVNVVLCYGLVKDFFDGLRNSR